MDWLDEIIEYTESMEPSWLNDDEILPCDLDYDYPPESENIPTDMLEKYLNLNLVD